MKMSRICSSFLPGNLFWLLSITVVLIVLTIWSRLSELDAYSSKSYVHQAPLKLPSKGPNDPPILAYWISGTRGENPQLLRLLKAVYHPRNQYLLSLDAASPDQERDELAVTVQSDRIFQAFGNVNVAGKSNVVNQKGASAVAAVLHAGALLLKLSADWDWLTTLTSSDYPLFTQDDILYAFSSLPKDVNFVRFYSNETGPNDWRQNVDQIVLDPNLYLKEKSPIIYATEKREKPDAFQIFGGSPWVTLSRGFMEHCVSGWDNLPRKLLMYFNNVVFPLELYFHSVFCNTPEFQNTTINNDLRYTTDHDAANMSRYYYDDDSHDESTSGAIFAGPFGLNDPILQELDQHVLNRAPEGLVPGKWCEYQGKNDSSQDPTVEEGNSCSVWGNIDIVKPHGRGMKLKNFFTKLVEEKNRVISYCHKPITEE